MVEKDALGNLKGAHEIRVKLTDEVGLTKEYTFFIQLESLQNEFKDISEVL
jgi:hypothetical protein